MSSRIGIIPIGGSGAARGFKSRHGMGAGCGAGFGSLKYLRMHFKIRLGGTLDLPTSQGLRSGSLRHP